MRVCLFAALFIAARLAHGQPVYRCGNLYSQAPCATEAKALQMGHAQLGSQMIVRFDELSAIRSARTVGVAQPFGPRR